MNNVRRAAVCLLLLASSLPAAAAPGAFTSTGPYGVIDIGVQDLFFAADDPRQLLARTQADVFASHDGGASWRSIYPGRPRLAPAQLLADPGDAQRFYVVDSLGLGAGIALTTDGGRSFTALPLPIEDDPELYRDLHLLVDAAQGANLALEIWTSDLEEYRHFVSRDRGATWQQLERPGWSSFDLSFRALHGGRLYTVSETYDLATGRFADAAGSLIPNAAFLLFDRERLDTLFAVFAGVVYKSTDRGATFRAIYAPPFAGTFHFLVQSAKNPSHLALATTAGLALSLDRGESWTAAGQGFGRDAAFDPATGELLLAGQELFRRRLDGSLGPPLPLAGFDGSWIAGVTARDGRALATRYLGGVPYRREGEGPWRAGRLPAGSSCGGETWPLLFSQPGKAALVCETGAVFTSADGGATFTASPDAPQLGSGWVFATAAGDVVYFLHGGRVSRSADFGVSWQLLAGAPFQPYRLAAHPDPARGLLAVAPDGRLARWQPDAGWQELAAQVPEGASGGISLAAIAHALAFPDLVYGLRRGLLSKSTDFGASWTPVASLDDTLPAPYRWEYLPAVVRPLLDPFDADHLILLGQGFETRDGGLSFIATDEAMSFYGAFDPLVPGRFLGARDGAAGVSERTATLPACPQGSDAWCAAGGRYLLSVDWRDYAGLTGRGRKVATGSEDSGLFYFFDPSNWELLVKALDGCGLNHRQWLFAAGTTDVEYVLRVVDRWTGQIRHYYNAPGQPAPAVADIGAFAGCETAPPPGAAPPALVPAAAGGAGEPTLPLVGGRFAASARWTNFSGQEGDALTAPLASDNSGLFYFFSPNNWEMLVKVLDGCAINGHYWVLAAATTDVGYELTITDTRGGPPKVYRNPVGRASPAQIDLQAFACR